MKLHYYLILLALAVFGCKKDSTDQYIQSSKDHSLALQNSVDLIAEVQTVGRDYLEDGVFDGDTLLNISSTPVYGSNTYPKTIVINYGNDGYLRSDNKTRKGKIELTINSASGLNGDYSIVLDSFYVENTNIVGALDCSVNGGTNAYTFQEGLRFINANGTVQWSGSLSAETISSTEQSISFNVSGQDSKGTSFSAVQGIAPSADLTCTHLIVAGTSLVTPNDRDQQTANYGSGDCESNVTVTFSDASTLGFNLQ